jgi:hypothetical protein
MRLNVAVQRMTYPCAKGRVGGTGLDKGPGKSIETHILKFPLNDGNRALNSL